MTRQWSWNPLKNGAEAVNSGVHEQNVQNYEWLYGNAFDVHLPPQGLARRLERGSDRRARPCGGGVAVWPGH